MEFLNEKALVIEEKKIQKTLQSSVIEFEEVFLSIKTGTSKVFCCWG
jgi:hypothetical protein